MNKLVNGKVVSMTAEEETAYNKLQSEMPEQIFGGGMELILDAIADGDASLIKYDVDKNGQPFSLRRMVAVILRKPLESKQNTPACPFVFDKSVKDREYWGFSSAPRLSSINGTDNAVVNIVDLEKINGLVYVNNVYKSMNNVSAWDGMTRDNGTFCINKNSLNDTTTPILQRHNIDCVGLGSGSPSIGKGSRIMVYGIRE